MPTPIFDLCDEHVQRSCALDPVVATYLGVAGEFPPGTDYSPNGHDARAQLMRDTLRRLEVLPPTGDADRLAASHLRERLAAQLAWHDTGEPLRAVRAPFGLLQSIRNSIDLMPRHTEQDRRALVDRVAAVPQMLHSWRASLVVGAARGTVAARRQAVEAAAQAQRYAEAASFQQVPDGLAQESTLEGALHDELATAAAAADAAYAETAAWLREVYAPQAAEADGVGAERYAVASRLSLGDTIDFRDAYDWAWGELHRLEREMATEAARVLPGASVDEAIAHLDRAEVRVGIDAYRDWLRERHDEAIARLHGVHFDIPEQLRTVDVETVQNSSAGAPYYTPPSEDLRRPGRTWWPAGARESFAVWAELTTVYHEGVPGHHLQLGQARVAGEELSRFSRLSVVSGHSEGWALYAERLADELGWHTAPGTRLGMLKASALRAARVVIDIGIHLDLPLPEDEASRHGARWSFETATEVLRDRGRIAAHRLHPELVRYCGWPGQAISYKLGERAWLAARDEARQRLGAAFDLQRWHTDALSLGPVGLATLAETLRSITDAARYPR